MVEREIRTRTWSKPGQVQDRIKYRYSTKPMTIPKPIYNNVRCPNCHGLGSIEAKNSFRYWLADSYWKCSCGYVGSTMSFQEASRAVLVYPRPEQVLVAGAGI